MPSKLINLINCATNSRYNVFYDFFPKNELSRAYSALKLRDKPGDKSGTRGNTRGNLRAEYSGACQAPKGIRLAACGAFCRGLQHKSKGQRSGWAEGRGGKERCLSDIFPHGRQIRYAKPMGLTLPRRTAPSLPRHPFRPRCLFAFAPFSARGARSCSFRRANSCAPAAENDAMRGTHRLQACSSAQKRE